MGRRAFLKGLGVTAGAGLLFGGKRVYDEFNPEPIPKTDFDSPPDRAHLKAYAELDAAIPEAVYELMNSPRKMTFGDIGRPITIDVTIIPPSDKSPGALEYTIDGDKERGYRFPMVNRMLKACADIMVLDMEMGSQDRLDFEKVAEKIEYQIQRFRNGQPVHEPIQHDQPTQEKDRDRVAMRAPAHQRNKLREEQECEARVKAAPAQRVETVAQIKTVANPPAPPRVHAKVEQPAKKEEKRGKLPFPLSALLQDMPEILKGVTELTAPYNRELPTKLPCKEGVFCIYPTDVIPGAKWLPLERVKAMVKKEIHVTVLNPETKVAQEKVREINKKYHDERDPALIAAPADPHRR